MSIEQILKKVKWTIVAFIDYFKFNIDVKKFNSNNEESYILFSHEGDNNGGAPIVLYELAKKIKNDGNSVIFLYKYGGKLKQKCESDGMNSYVYYGNLDKYIKKLSKVSISKVIVNTVVCGKCVNKVQNITDKPIIWWIHEIGELVDRFSSEFPKEIRDNVHIKSVSNESMKSMRKYYKNAEISTMNYGCEDIYNESLEKIKYKNEKKDDYFEIVVIGQICERKNQLQVFKSYNLLPDYLKEKVCITFIASTWNKEYKIKFDKEIEKYPNMKLIEGVEHREIYKVYLSSDLLVCSSIEDPLPVVVTEAMMFKCPVVISDGCGQFKYIENGINGFTYKVESDKALAISIEEAYNKRSDTNIADNARNIFLEKFSFECIKSKIYDLK